MWRIRDDMSLYKWRKVCFQVFLYLYNTYDVCVCILNTLKNLLMHIQTIFCDNLFTFTSLVEFTVFQIHACVVVVDTSRIYWKNHRFFFLLQQKISNAKFLVY